MKQRKLIMWISILALVMTIVVCLTSSVYAAEDTDRTRIVLERNVQKDNVIHAYIDIAEQESISSFQVSLKVGTANKQDINDIIVNWNTGIKRSAILYRANYDKEAGTLNLYVVSKEELTTVNQDGNVILDIGNIVVNSKNTKDIQVEIGAVENSLRIVSISHTGKDVVVDNNVDKITLDISKKAEEPTPDPGPGDNTNTVGPNTNTVGPNTNTVGPNVNTVEPGNNTINPEANTVEPDSNNVIQNTNIVNNINTNKTETENKATGSIPQTGVMSIFKNPLMIGIIIIALCLVSHVTYIKMKDNKRRF